ncbi:MAG: ice-binding family protein [Salinivirgaceae bacterium]
MKLKNVFTIAAMLLVVTMVGCKKDDATGEDLVVTSTNPVNHSTSIAVNSVITATFNLPINVSTITDLNFTLNHDTVNVHGIAICNGTTATFTPTVNLTSNTLYTVTISKEVQSTTGSQLVSDYVWSFTTSAFVDVIVPTVIVTNPLNDATEVALDKIIAITFSEEMNPASLTATTFTLKNGNTVVSGVVSSSGTEATFTPSALLQAGITYTANVSTEVKDLAGNALAVNTEWSFTTGGTIASLAPVDLGAAGNYVILGKSAITNISISAITGDLGLSPAATSYITGLSLTDATGYATSVQVTGKIYAADMADPTPINLTTAVENMITAYNDAAGRPTPDFLELGTGNIGGKTLSPGLYKWTNTVTITSDVTISGSADDVWIFQIAEDLTMSSAVNVTLIGGAQAKNIFWQVAGQVTFGATSHMEGIILSMTGITYLTGATMHGRALAQTAVVLDGNAVTQP